mgnify:CR=1 FL=1
MGVWDLFKSKPPVEKASKQLREPYAQPEARETAMNKLFEIGTDEAYDAVLKRFTFNASGQIADESEKRQLVERLAATGQAVVPALQRFIRTESNLTFPIQALQQILPGPEVTEFLVETLQSHDPRDHRSTQAKTQLVVSLAELLPSDRAEVLVPYLHDHSDDVQFQVIVALEHLAHPPTKDALIDVCCTDEHAGRIRRRAAQALAALEWSVKHRFEDFDPELRDEWQVTKKGSLSKRTA